MGREARLRVVSGDGPREQRRGQKVVIGYPCGGSVTVPFHASCLNLLKYELTKPDSRRLLGQMTHSSGLYVADNRTMLAQRFMEAPPEEADWLLQIDTDIEFPPNLLELMLAAAGTDRKVVAANLPLGEGYATSGFFWDTPGRSTVCMKVMPREADLVECDAVATAVFLVHRSVFEDIAKRDGQCWFNHLYMPESPEGTPVEQFRYRSIGEDIAFCVRAQRAGHKIYVARVRGLRHYKTRALSEDFEVADDAPTFGPAMGALVEER